MQNFFTTKRALQIGTAIIWGAVLLGASLVTEAESNVNLDWELMWIIVGGFIIQNTLIGLCINKDKGE